MAEANWYVVHTYSGYENKVKANIEKTIENRHLEEEILEVRVPMQDGRIRWELSREWTLANRPPPSMWKCSAERLLWKSVLQKSAKCKLYSLFGV